MTTCSVTFYEGSLLLDLLKRKSDFIVSTTEPVLFSKVINFIKTEIIKYKLFVFSNPFILKFNYELEQALGVKYLHEKELLGYIFAQLQLDNEENSLLLRQEYCRWAYSDYIGYPIWTTDYQALDLFVVWQPTLGNSTLVLPCETLSKFLLASCRIRKSQSTFRFKSILKFVSNYLIKNKSILVDLRNISVFNLTGDPLGKALQLTYIDISQLRTVVSNRVMKVHRKS